MPKSPYLQSQKNDANDAAAICEAISRPQMRFVPGKTVEQQHLQALHRVRSRLIGTRTQIGNQIRGLLAEYGIVLPQHLSYVRKMLPQLTEESEARLSGFAKRLFTTLYEELCALDRRILGIEAELNQAFSAECIVSAHCGSRGNRSGHSDSRGRRHRERKYVPQRASVRRLAWAGSAAKLQRREAAPLWHYQER